MNNRDTAVSSPIWTARTRSGKARRLLAASLFMIWLTLTVMAFWWFQYRPIRLFDDGEAMSLEFFLGRDLATQIGLAPQATGRVTLIHYWDPGCPCSRFSREHVNDLMRGYTARGVDFLIVVRADGATPAEREKLRQLARQRFPAAGNAPVRTDWPEQGMPPSSPALAITGASGQLAYFGPYSEGGACGVGAGGFAERSLEGLLLGKETTRINTLVAGCYCPWRDSEQA